MATHLSLNLCIRSACKNRHGLIWKWLRLIEQRPTLAYLSHFPFYGFLLLCCSWKKKSFIYFHLIRCYSVLYLMGHAKPKEWVRDEHTAIPSTRCASYAYRMCVWECVQKQELPLWHCNVFSYVDHLPPTHTGNDLVVAPASFWCVRAVQGEDTDIILFAVNVLMESDECVKQYDVGC